MPIQDKMMRGGTNIRSIIATHLSNVVPPTIDIMIAQNADLSLAKLPYPKAYNVIDPLDSKEFPVFGAFLTGADKFEYTTVEPTGAFEIDPIYEVTIFVTVKTLIIGTDAAGLPIYEKPVRESAIRARDDYLAILANVVINNPSLGTAGLKYRAKVNTDSIRLSYPEPIQDNLNFIASGFMNLTINYTETTVVPYYGNANQISTEVDILEN